MVLTQARRLTSAPPGGCLCKVVEIVSRDIPIICHAMMPIAAGQQIAFVQPQVEAFFQRLNMMHRQIRFQPRHAEDAIAAFVAYPAKMKIPSDDLISFFLPCVGLSKTGNFSVTVRCRFRFLWADIPFRMDPPTISA